jgi:ABC-type polar amino acid transport system ATPase subunit
LALLFDEPTSALDPESSGDVLDVMRELSEQGMTMFVVTHELGFAADISDRIVFIDEGAVIEARNGRELIDSPEQARTRAFVDTYRRRQPMATPTPQS